MQPDPMRPSNGDNNPETPSEDSFSEECDAEAYTENLASGNEDAPIKRYSYSKPV
jgi:hypothetical protein